VTRGEVVWTPPADVLEISRIGHFLSWLSDTRGLSFEGYEDLWRWSVDDLDGFWGSFTEWIGVQWRAAPTAVLAERAMPGAVWFPGGTLNWAEHALARAAERPNDVAIVARSQTRDGSDLTWADFADAVARCRAGLRRLGVGRGDRVCAYAPNIPETLIAFAATASLGAIWSSCAPEFGTRAVVDRFAQVEPKVLFAIDGYRYGTKVVDRREEVSAIEAALRRWSTPYECAIWARAPMTGARCSPSTSRSNSTRCRSTTRCTCSTAQAPPACRRQSCTDTAASWWSTSR